MQYHDEHFVIVEAHYGRHITTPNSKNFRFDMIIQNRKQKRTNNVFKEFLSYILLELSEYIRAISTCFCGCTCTHPHCPLPQSSPPRKKC